MPIEPIYQVISLSFLVNIMIVDSM